MPFERTISEDLSLLQAHPDHAERLHKVIERDRDYLARWLPWATAQDLAGTRRFLEWAVEKEASSGAPTWLISTNGVLAGVVGSLPIDAANRSATLGYWIGAGQQGRGLVSRSVRAMITDLFEARGLNRVEIRACTENTASCRVAERLGFVREGVLRESVLLHGRPVDMALYAMLAREWAGREESGR